MPVRDLLFSLPPVGSLVVYFPQGHSEQVSTSMEKESDEHIPNYPILPSKLICQLHNVTLHADAKTNEGYAQMILQPVNTYDKEALLASDLDLKQSKQPTEFFCKTLTANDTSTHGGFSVPRRATEKFFPTLEYSMKIPAQELMARDLHDHPWTFRRIYHGTNLKGDTRRSYVGCMAGGGDHYWQPVRSLNPSVFRSQIMKNLDLQDAGGASSQTVYISGSIED